MMQNRSSRLALTVVMAVFLVIGVSLADDAKAEGSKPVVLMETTLGSIKIELWEDKAPVTVKNFLRYADEKFYDNTVFHRVISGFMIQGGGLTATMERKKPHEPIKNEASQQLKNDRGTIAMARTSQIHSATSQFFINLASNGFLNHRDDTPRGYGYVAFGRIIEGMDVVDRIGGVKTTTVGPYKDVPATPVIIKSVRRVHTQQ
jgi:cyclophilin family peptidyl-prolyl cis-trans isomerase